MWYLSSWRDLRRRSNAGHGLGNKPEITPPSHSYHRPDGTAWALAAPLDRDRHGAVQPRRRVPLADRGHRHHHARRAAHLPYLRGAGPVRARPDPRTHARRPRRCHGAGRKSGRKPVITGDKLKRARGMVGTGLTVREIATRLKVGKTALYEALRAEPD